MVEDMGNMHDVLRVFCQAQEEVVILRPVVCCVKSTECREDLFPYDLEVSDVAGGKERLLAPVWLEFRIISIVSPIDFIVVGVQKIRSVRRTGDTGSDHSECSGFQEVIMIKESDVLRTCSMDAGVCCCTDASVVREADDLDAAIHSRGIVGDLFSVTGLWAIQGEKEFPVWVVLLEDGVDGCLEEARIRVVDWHDNR